MQSHQASQHERSLASQDINYIDLDEDLDEALANLLRGPEGEGCEQDELEVSYIKSHHCDVHSLPDTTCCSTKLVPAVCHEQHKRQQAGVKNPHDCGHSDPVPNLASETSVRKARDEVHSGQSPIEITKRSVNLVREMLDRLKKDLPGASPKRDWLLHLHVPVHVSSSDLPPHKKKRLLSPNPID